MENKDHHDPGAAESREYAAGGGATACCSGGIEETVVVMPITNIRASGSSTLGRRILLAANYCSLVVGSLAATLLSRFYFVHGGSDRWVSTLVQCAGFPLLFIPIYFSRRSGAGTARASVLVPRLLVLCVLIGVLLGVNNFLISWGVSYLPVSTSSLLLSSQLGFTLFLSALLVHQPIRFANVNCVLCLTLASVLLAVNSSGDAPPGIVHSQYALGFLATLGAAVLFSLYLPLVQWTYRRPPAVESFRTVMEMQVVMEAAATGFALVGMATGGGFEQMGREAAREFDKGTAWYWATIAATVLSWQLCFMATAGLVFLTSSLNSGICSTATLVVNVVGGVVAFGDSFGGQKAVALVLCTWGFVSYLCGEYYKTKNTTTAAAAAAAAGIHMNH
ncbi:probable purine permease 4 [Zingiber officinale]|uniref:Probable purine permease n=1 Tax=Zingiber officinale TaxID=94328 RepID=A0A8J5H9X1_ZINOF|nr:probable purine permease 4 [Zingiber officinale]KAG6514734.1 hypothetical protein ZIOFF_025104 [Zingiber officinale]